jgi:hypothetical protein
MPREIQAGVSEVSVLCATLFKMYVNDVHLALFADDTCLYATDRNIRSRFTYGFQTSVCI